MFLKNSSKLLPGICRLNGFCQMSTSARHSVNSEQRTYTYYTAKDIEFCPGRAKDIMQNNVAETSQQDKADEPFYQGKKFHVEDPMSERDHAEVYKADGSVNLYSCMQSNVPEPFASRSKAPTHMNMPGGGCNRDHKYVSEKFQQAHQWKH